MNTFCRRVTMMIFHLLKENTQNVKNTAGKCFALSDAMKTLLPEYFGEGNNEKTTEAEVKEVHSEDADDTKDVEEATTSVGEHTETKQPSVSAKIKLIRIQGIEPKPEIPFSWVVNNLMNPDHYLHICVYLIHC